MINVENINIFIIIEKKLYLLLSENIYRLIKEKNKCIDNSSKETFPESFVLFHNTN